MKGKFGYLLMRLFFGVPSFRTFLGMRQFLLNSVGCSVASPRQVPLSLHLSVGFPLHPLTQNRQLRFLDLLDFLSQQIPILSRQQSIFSEIRILQPLKPIYHVPKCINGVPNSINEVLKCINGVIQRGKWGLEPLKWGCITW
jgi:hypothetical protein